MTATLDAVPQYGMSLYTRPIPLITRCEGRVVAWGGGMSAYCTAEPCPDPGRSAVKA